MGSTTNKPPTHIHIVRYAFRARESNRHVHCVYLRCPAALVWFQDHKRTSPHIVNVPTVRTYVHTVYVFSMVMDCKYSGTYSTYVCTYRVCVFHGDGS